MRSYDVKETAKVIRETLKTAFPLTRFSVRLDRFSGGCSIDATWTDGPTGKQVKAILDRFGGKGFDGMVDLAYDCGERIWKGEKVDFHSGYVRGTRSVSKGATATVAARLAQEVGIAMPAIDEWGNVGDHNLRVPYQWWDHWMGSADQPKEFLTMADIEAPGHLLAHDSHDDGGEYFTRLVARVTDSLSLEPVQQPVELPEYIDKDADVETGRARFEQKHKMFAHHEGVQ